MIHKLYGLSDNCTELLPEHASLTQYRATYCFPSNPSGCGTKATIVFPEGRSGEWVIAKFDVPLYDPEENTFDPAGVWLTFAVKAFEDFDEVERPGSSTPTTAQHANTAGATRQTTATNPKNVRSAAMSACRAEVKRMKTMNDTEHSERQNILVRLGATAEALESFGDGGLDIAYEISAVGAAESLIRSIHQCLDGKEWDSETCQFIANHLDNHGVPVRDFEDDTGLTADQLAAKYAEHDGGWGQHPRFDRAEWRLEVCSEDTQLGYWDWVVSQIEQEVND